MAKKMQTVKVRDYGDAAVNRLAVICDQIAKMPNDREREASLKFVMSKYNIDPDTLH